MNTRTDRGLTFPPTEHLGPHHRVEKRKRCLAARQAGSRSACGFLPDAPFLARSLSSSGLGCHRFPVPFLITGMSQQKARRHLSVKIHHVVFRASGKRKTDHHPSALRGAVRFYAPVSASLTAVGVACQRRFELSIYLAAKHLEKIYILQNRQGKKNQGTHAVCMGSGQNRFCFGHC